MVSTKHTQSLTDFRQRATQTLDRLNKTGDAEIITVNGEARAILLSPGTYDELAREAMLNRDVNVIRKAMKEIDDGQATDAGDFFDSLRAKVLALKPKAQSAAAKKLASKKRGKR